MLSCGAAFSLREANDTEMKTTFTPYDSDDVLTATVNGSGDESKITLSAQDSSNVFCQVVIGQCGVSFPSEKAVGFSPVRNWPVIARVLLFHCIRA